MLRTAVIVAVMVAASPNARSEPGDRWDGVMVLQQAGAGIGGAILAGGVLGVSGLGIGVASSSGRGNWGAPIAGAVIGGGIGIAAGIAVGVKLAGDARGGNGGWAATIGGTVGGGLITFASASQYIERVPPYIAGAFMTITLLAPPIVAYHLSSDENADVENRITVPLILGFF